MSQALTVSLGAEYIMQRSTLILYDQIYPTSLRVSLPPCLFNPSFDNMKDSAGGKGCRKGKERSVTHISRTTGQKRCSGDEMSEGPLKKDKGTQVEQGRDEAEDGGKSRGRVKT